MSPPHTGALLLCDCQSSLEIPPGVEVLEKPFTARTLRKRVERVLACARCARFRLADDLRLTEKLLQDTRRVLSGVRATLEEFGRWSECSGPLHHCSEDTLEHYCLGQLAQPDLGSWSATCGSAGHAASGKSKPRTS